MNHRTRLRWATFLGLVLGILINLVLWDHTLDVWSFEVSVDRLSFKQLAFLTVFMALILLLEQLYFAFHTAGFI